MFNLVRRLPEAGTFPVSVGPQHPYSSGPPISELRANRDERRACTKFQAGREPPLRKNDAKWNRQFRKETRLRAPDARRDPAVEPAGLAFLPRFDALGVRRQLAVQALDVDAEMLGTIVLECGQRLHE